MSTIEKCLALCKTKKFSFSLGVGSLLYLDKCNPECQYESDDQECKGGDCDNGKSDGMVREVTRGRERLSFMYKVEWGKHRVAWWGKQMRML